MQAAVFICSNQSCNMVIWNSISINHYFRILRARIEAFFSFPLMQREYALDSG